MFQICSIVLTSFRQRWSFYPPTPTPTPPNAKQAPKNPTLIRVNLTLLSFARDDFAYQNPSTELLFEILLMKAKDFQATTLLKGTRKNYVFTAEEDVGNIVAGDNGAYLVTASATRQFKGSSGEFYFKKRVG